MHWNHKLITGENELEAVLGIRRACFASHLGCKMLHTHSWLPTGAAVSTRSHKVTEDYTLCWGFNGERNLLRRDAIWNNHDNNHNHNHNHYLRVWQCLVTSNCSSYLLIGTWQQVQAYIPNSYNSIHFLLVSL